MPDPNHAVLYRFAVVQGREADFVAAWEALTRLILEHCGSHGSCLHRSGAHEFIAYARWPSAAALKAARGDHAELQAARDALRAVCEDVETLHSIDVVADLLAVPSRRG